MKDISRVALAGDAAAAQSSEGSLEATRVHIKILERIACILNELMVFLNEVRDIWRQEKRIKEIVRTCIFHMLFNETGSSEVAREWISKLLGEEVEVKEICVYAFAALFDCLQVRKLILID